jgi:hypothetical protein
LLCLAWLFSFGIAGNCTLQTCRLCIALFHNRVYFPCARKCIENGPPLLIKMLPYGITLALKPSCMKKLLTWQMWILTANFANIFSCVIFPFCYFLTMVADA